MECSGTLSSVKHKVRNDADIYTKIIKELRDSLTYNTSKPDSGIELQNITLTSV